jgi:FixJ family two-component response regulator
MNVPTASPTRDVFVVDDDPGVLTAIGRLLRTAGYRVSTFDSASSFLADHDPEAPGCALVDIHMLGLDGLSLQQELNSRGESRPIVFLTGSDDVLISVRAMKSGAFDYLLKPIKSGDLMAVIDIALQADDVARKKRKELNVLRRRHDSLTPREKEVIVHVVQGLLNKTIAARLGIVEKTVKVHRAHIMEKMQVRSLAALVHVSEQLGIGPNP